MNYMMASGADDGSFRIWDLRAFTQGSHVSHFGFHRAAVTSIEWCPYEGSMLATCSADNQLAVSPVACRKKWRQNLPLHLHCSHLHFSSYNCDNFDVCQHRSTPKISLSCVLPDCPWPQSVDLPGSMIGQSVVQYAIPDCQMHIDVYVTASNE